MSESSKGKKWTEESKQKRRKTMMGISDSEVYEVYIRSNNEPITNKELGKQYGISGTKVSMIKNLKTPYIREVVNLIKEGCAK